MTLLIDPDEEYLARATSLLADESVRIVTASHSMELVTKVALNYSTLNCILLDPIRIRKNDNLSRTVDTLLLGFKQLQEKVFEWNLRHMEIRQIFMQSDWNTEVVT